jgi:hypothetical protein
MSYTRRERGPGCLLTSHYPRANPTPLRQPFGHRTHERHAVSRKRNFLIFGIVSFVIDNGSIRSTVLHEMIAGTVTEALPNAEAEHFAAALAICGGNIGLIQY